jgi:formylglycine-generating enzyme required for sulfatase activity
MPGAEFRDAQGLPLMVTIPPGSFAMGSPTTETGRYNREGPQQEVRIAYTLAVGKYPVTVGEWRKFVRATQRYSATSASVRSWYSPGFRQDESHPVTCVSWHDASDYANWVSNQTGKSYRLLTEAEWEYACRAGTTTRYAFGDDITPQQANFHGTKGGTTSVGAYSPNPFGLSDMHGNVWEWCADCYRDTLEGQARNGEAFKEPRCSHRVIPRRFLGQRPAGPPLGAPQLKGEPTLRNFDLGFRVARTLSSTP